jgi:hypothetical protein
MAVAGPIRVVAGVRVERRWGVSASAWRPRITTPDAVGLPNRDGTERLSEERASREREDVVA